MSYTLEQKREALAKGDLWWRFPEFDDDHHRKWTLMNVDLDGWIAMLSDFDMPGAEYHIGPTAPRVLSELDGELLDLLNGVLKMERGSSGRIIIEGWQEEAIRAAIQKAEAQQ